MRHVGVLFTALLLLASSCEKPLAGFFGQSGVLSADVSSAHPLTAPSPTASTGSESTPTESTIPVSEGKMVFQITFADAPNDASVTAAPLKYGKKGWMSFEWDDGSTGSLAGLAKMKTKFYTDGAGGSVSFRGAVAVNGRAAYANAEMGDNYPNKVTYANMSEMIAAGWDIENHSFYHEPTGNFNYGTDRARNIKELDELIHARLKYKMNGHVVPTNYTGFPTAAKEFGYLFSTSQGTFDNLPPGNPNYKTIHAFADAPKSFSSFARLFSDDWVDLEKRAKAAFDLLLAAPAGSYFRFGTHTIDEQAFGRVMDYFEDQSKDEILIVSTREVMEYRIVADLPRKSTLNGRVLTVEIDTSTLPDRFRWRDLSLMVTSDAKISSVTPIGNIDRATFNAETGLVNVFKQKTSW